jgi:hypothetical protein
MTINLTTRGTTAPPLRPALVLLLTFMTGCGIVTGMAAGRRDR